MSNFWSRAALIPWLVACACGGGNEQRGFYSTTSRSASTSSAALRWCDSMCASARRCEGESSSGCQEGCRYANSAFFARTSDASLAHQSRCLEESACPAVFDDQLQSCWEDALDHLEPSAEAEAQCEELAPEFFDCGWFASPASCARIHANYSSEALASERECQGSSCDALQQCIVSRLYRYGAE